MKETTKKNLQYLSFALY